MKKACRAERPVTPVKAEIIEQSEDYLYPGVKNYAEPEGLHYIVCLTGAINM
jgi:hypothetical protein